MTQTPTQAKPKSQQQKQQATAKPKSQQQQQQQANQAQQQFRDAVQPTKQQQQLLNMVTQGRGFKQIGQKMNVSLKVFLNSILIVSDGFLRGIQDNNEFINVSNKDQAKMLLSLFLNEYSIYKDQLSATEQAKLRTHYEQNMAKYFLLNEIELLQSRRNVQKNQQQKRQLTTKIQPLKNNVPQMLRDNNLPSISTDNDSWLDYWRGLLNNLMPTTSTAPKQGQSTSSGQGQNVVGNVQFGQNVVGNVQSGQNVVGNGQSTSSKPGGVRQVQQGGGSAASTGKTSLFRGLINRLWGKPDSGRSGWMNKILNGILNTFDKIQTDIMSQTKKIVSLLEKLKNSGSTSDENVKELNKQTQTLIQSLQSRLSQLDPLIDTIRKLPSNVANAFLKIINDYRTYMQDKIDKLIQDLKTIASKMNKNKKITDEDVQGVQNITGSINQKTQDAVNQVLSVQNKVLLQQQKQKQKQPKWSPNLTTIPQQQQQQQQTLSPLQPLQPPAAQDQSQKLRRAKQLKQLQNLQQNLQQPQPQTLSPLQPQQSQQQRRAKQQIRATQQKQKKQLQNLQQNLQQPQS